MKTAQFRFGLDGMVSKEDPTLLKDGQYRQLVNAEVLQEGGIASMAGRKALGNGGTGPATIAYRIQKMVLGQSQGVTPENPSIPSQNPRYVGISDNNGIKLYRTLDYNTFTDVSTNSPTPTINTAAGVCRKRFQVASYTAGETGSPWAFIAAELGMLKDNGNSLYSGGSGLRRWGILPMPNVPTVTNAGAGNLDGGNASSPNGSQPYDYRVTSVATDTNNEGNPSEIMLTDSAVANGTPISGHLFEASLSGYGVGDSQVGFLNIYRRGGTLFDTWRLVGQVANPGAGLVWALTDNIADVDLVTAPQINLYNDPPVPSTVPSRITGSLAAIASAGRQAVNVTLGTLAGVTPGTTLNLFYDNPEAVIIEAINSTTQFVAYFQHTHSAGADFEIDTICGQACNLAIAYQQFILVAGDPNNPHLIYRSTGGTPESFPPVPADGSTAIAACGSPSNPILAMTEFRGAILTLNANSIFEALIINGTLIQGTEVAKKGLAAPFAWCKTENEIWFLSTDGIYSYDGSNCRKRSEAIDGIFHQQQVNTIPPISLAGLISTSFSASQPPAMAYYRNRIRFLYLDNSGNRRLLMCEPTFGDRWSMFQPSLGGQTQMLYTEDDTGSCVESLYGPVSAAFALYDQELISGGVNYTTDLFSSDPRTSGSYISFDIRLPWFDFGDPFKKKILSEALLDLDVSGAAPPTATLAIDILVDYADQGTLFNPDPSAVDTLTVSLAIPPGRSQPISLLPALESAAGNIQALGREIRAVSYHIYGTAGPTRMQFFRLAFRYDDIADLTAGGPTDWSNLGHPWDKKLYTFTVEFDVAGIGQQIALDIISGPGSGAYTPAAQVFTLDNPTLSDSSPGRATQSFAISDTLSPLGNSVVKEVRVRPFAGTSLANPAATGSANTVLFKILRVDFGQFEKFPPDVISFTPWENGGSEYLKYANQLDLEVNTNDLPIQVVLQADGNPVIVNGTEFIFVVQTSERNRTWNQPIPPNLAGYEWRIWIDPTQPNLINPNGSAQGMFQLFRHRWSFQPADKGDIVHSEDWKDHGHPYDKRLQVCTVEWDNTHGADVQLQMDLLTGISGGTLIPNVAQFDLGSNIGRSQKSFPLADSLSAAGLPYGLIAKKTKVYPTTAPLPVGFRVWSYSCKFEPFPPDIVFFTEPKVFSDYEAIPRTLRLWINTDGLPAQVWLIADGQVVDGPYTVTTTVDDRERVITTALNLLGKVWKLKLRPSLDGTGNPQARAQLFDWKLDVIPEPAALTAWSSYQQTLGYRGWKFLKQLWLYYLSAQPLNVALASDTGGFLVELPAHTTRAVERVLLPTTWAVGLNKSKLYDLSITPVSGTFKLYAGISGLEWLACGADRHAAYRQTTLSEFVQLESA